MALVALVAAGLLGAAPIVARAAPVAPASPWETLSTDAPHDASASPQNVPDATWAGHVRGDVELTLRGGAKVVGRIYRDNGGSVTLVRPDQAVQVILKTDVTHLRPLELAPEAGLAGVPVTAPPIDRDRAVEQELRSGKLARDYRKARNLAITGGIVTGVGASFLIPGIVVLANSPRQPGAVVLTALGGMFTFMGLSAMGAGLAKRARTRRKAVRKLGFAPWGAPDGGGLMLQGRF
jgi:hypothetical protein